MGFLWRTLLCVHLASRMGSTPLTARVMGGVVCGEPMGVFTNVALGDLLGFPAKGALIKDEPIRVAVFHLSRLNGERPGTPPSNGGRSKRRLDQ